jgi:hypothetical protein
VAATAKDKEASHSKWIELPEPSRAEPLVGVFFDLHQPNPLAGGSGQIVFRLFALVTFI